MERVFGPMRIIGLYCGQLRAVAEKGSLTIFLVLLPAFDVTIATSCLKDDGPLGNLAEEWSRILCKRME